jgi:hypothetical protein
MEKFIYFLIIISGIRVFYVNICEFSMQYKAYRIFTKNGFCPSEMNIECECEKCRAIASAMTPEELESDKKNHYHFVKDKLKNKAIDDLCLTVFCLSIVIFAVIKYLN